MSLSYTHLLIPRSPDYRPEANAVVQFVRGIINNGNVAAGSDIAFSSVVKGQPRVRQMRNTMTGETIDIAGPSRTINRPQQLSDAAQIIEHSANQQEYDVSISGEGVPSCAPFPVGYVEDDNWKLMDGPYHLEVRCRVRANIVQLETESCPLDRLMSSSRRFHLCFRSRERLRTFTGVGSIRQEHNTSF